MHTLYSMVGSGNCYKARWIMALTGQKFRVVDVDIMNAETHTPEFIAKNPNGKIPLLEFEDGRLLAESNAILLHMAEGTSYLPEDAYERALVYQWLFFEQYSHETNIAVRRFFKVFAKEEPSTSRMEQLLKGGNKALKIMDEALGGNNFLVADTFTIADIALYGYTHVAKEGGFNLSEFPNVSRWLKNVSETDGFVTMEWLP